MVICVATSLTSILPASAQNSDQTDEYQNFTKKDHDAFRQFGIL